jgi:ATP-dependent RNA helicase RhlE
LTFKELNLHESVLEGLSAMGFETPTPIQEQAIPVIIENKDLIAVAQTGTGKTAAFLLPILHKICSNDIPDGQINTLIICPTRELAVQIDQQLEGLGYFTPATSLPIYGGGDGDGFSREKQALATGAHIIVGTPGKLISHLNLGYAKIDQLEHLILDEADRMLDMGFYEDLMRIIGFLPKKRQTLMFSATMPPKIRKLAKDILEDPYEISIAISKPAEKVVQVAFNTYNQQKIGLVKHLLRFNDIPSMVIFASTKIKVRELTKELQREGMNAKPISSDLEQKDREDILREFKSRKLQILVATDVISRGIDIDNIDMVLNFDVPNDAEDYIHRIGRTARASSEGEAVTFINEEDQLKFSKIEELIGTEIRKIALPEFLGEAPIYDPIKNRKKGQKSFGNKKGFKRR